MVQPTNKNIFHNNVDNLLFKCMRFIVTSNIMVVLSAYMHLLSLLAKEKMDVQLECR